MLSYPRTWFVLASLTFVGLVSVLGVVFSCAGVQAEEKTGAVTEPDMASNTDSLWVLVEPRTSEEILRDKEEARNRKSDAESSIDRCKILQERSKARVETKKAELDLIKSKIDLAKSEKNEAMRIEHETKKKIAELELSLLERKDDFRKLEGELAKAEKTYADATLAALEKELKLVSSREERTSLPRDKSPEWIAAETQRLDRMLREQEGQVLSAWIEEKSRRGEMAKADVELAKGRRKVFEAQLALGGNQPK